MEIREARFTDYEPIARLVSRIKLEMKGHQEWRSLWADNIRLFGRVAHRLGARKCDGRVLGYFGNIPLSFNSKAAASSRQPVTRGSWIAKRVRPRSC